MFMSFTLIIAIKSRLETLDENPTQVRYQFLPLPPVPPPTFLHELFGVTNKSRWGRGDCFATVAAAIAAASAATTTSTSTSTALAIDDNIVQVRVCFMCLLSVCLSSSLQLSVSRNGRPTRTKWAPTGTDTHDERWMYPTMSTTQLSCY